MASQRQTPTMLIRNKASSTSKPPPKFDHEMAEIYKRVAQNHYQETGPWKLMLNAIRQTNAPAMASFNVLDLASGPGEPAALIAKEFHQANVISTDFSEDMVTLAAETAAKIPNMSVEQADMQNLQFESSSFDIITCCYGFMFPPDKEKAIQEAHRCLKPGGTLIATTWNKSPMMELARDIMTKVLGEQPPPPPLNPMSLSEKDLFESTLTKHGFIDVKSQQSTYPFVMANDEELCFKMTTMLVKDKLEELNAWDQARDAYNEFSPRYISVDEDGSNLIDGNVFKLTLCKKAVVEDM